MEPIPFPLKSEFLISLRTYVITVFSPITSTGDLGRGRHGDGQVSEAGDPRGV